MKKLPVKQRRLGDDAALNYVQSRAQYTRTAAEENIVREWLRLLPAGSVVFDCPCGTGRFVRTIVELGYRYLGGDVSRAMVGQAKQISGSAQILGLFSADAETLPLADNSVDCVMVWRLLHHIADNDTRKRILREAARVSRGMVLVSFHHPLSFTFLRRCVKRLFTGDWQISDITHWRLAREAGECGLKLVETKSFGKFRSINWFAHLAKPGSPGRANGKLGNQPLNPEITIRAA